ncbi:hypothetical protein HFD88_003249 [Aspergillus terreus]|nr:hypothetical protein HFD88_003249 [Aspergillus terreus]
MRLFINNEFVNAKAMLKFADLMREQAEEIGLLETRAMGSAIVTQRGAYEQGSDLFTYYAACAIGRKHCRVQAI